VEKQKIVMTVNGMDVVALIVAVLLVGYCSKLEFHWRVAALLPNIKVIQIGLKKVK
jgi:hypothetical protein